MVQDNKYQGAGNPDMRKKCPHCGANTFTVSSSYGRTRIVENGKTVYNKLRREDAGSFRCEECNYYETY